MDLGLDFLGIPIDLAPMEARSASDLPEGDGWQFEPKWDGVPLPRLSGRPRSGAEDKIGKITVAFLSRGRGTSSRISPKAFVIDGELVIRVDGKPAFEALQNRLHPAATACSASPRKPRLR